MFELDSFHVHNKPERARIILQFYSQNKIKFNEFVILICMRIHYQERLILNGTHQLLAHANDISIVEWNIDTVQRNTKTLLDVSKEVGLEVNPKKTKYMLVSRC
jgi:adenosyl cobinamide kinase/adenosyl cobinamide phosphate guanylyltransferase